jgi:hypothetical protein
LFCIGAQRCCQKCSTFFLETFGINSGIYYFYIKKTEKNLKNYTAPEERFLSLCKAAGYRSLNQFCKKNPISSSKQRHLQTLKYHLNVSAPSSSCILADYAKALKTTIAAVKIAFGIKNDYCFREHLTEIGFKKDQQQGKTCFKHRDLFIVIDSGTVLGFSIEAMKLAAAETLTFENLVTCNVLFKLPFLPYSIQLTQQLIREWKQ